MNLQDWKTQVDQNLGDLARHVREWGPGMLYSALAATTLTPVIQAANQGDLAALTALGSVVGGIGGNLIAGQVQAWRDRSEEELAIELAQHAEADPEWRHALDALLEEFQAPRVVQAILSEADRDWFVEELRKEVATVGSDITVNYDLAVTVNSTGTGAVILTGDNHSLTQIVNHYQDEGGEADEERLRRQIAEYLKWVADRYGMIEMRGIKHEGQQVMQLDLETVYVPLEAAAPGGGSRRVPMNEILSRGDRLVITGGPGSGKTTVLQHVAWTLAQAILTDDASLAGEKLGLEVNVPGEDDPAESTKVLPLPILLPLSTYAQLRKSFEQSRDPQERTLANFVSYYLIEKQGGLDLPPDFFTRMLQSGRNVILLLDGLDEVPDDTERAAVRESVQNLLHGRDRIRVVVSCRTAAYRDRSVLGGGFRELRVQTLDEQHVADLVSHAYACVYPQDKVRRNEKTQELLNGIRYLEEQRRERMGEDAEPLIDSPLMVRMLLVVHLSDRRLPQHRAELYQRATDTMLWPEHTVDEEVAGRIGRLVGGSHEVHRDLAQHLAFGMHRRGQAQGREIDEETLRDLLAEEASLARYGDEFLRLTRLRGTVLEERQSVYRFIHLAFQEYLAARYMAEVLRSEGGTMAIVDYVCDGLVLDSWWREPILLTAGYLSLNAQQSARRFLRELANLTEPKRVFGADIELAAAALAATAALEWLPNDVELRNELSGRLTQLLHAAGSVSGRVQAANSLSLLGDPRLGGRERGCAGVRLGPRTGRHVCHGRRRPV